MDAATLNNSVEIVDAEDNMPPVDARGQLTRKGISEASKDIAQHENAMLDYFLSEKGKVEPEFMLGVTRLADDGVVFRFRTVREDELKKLQKRAATGKTLRSGNKEVDQYKLNRLLLVETMLIPNLKNIDIINRYGSPADALEARLLPGEISELSERILVKSGFSDDAVYEEDDDETDEVAIAKN